METAGEVYFINYDTESNIHMKETEVVFTHYFSSTWCTVS